MRPGFVGRGAPACPERILREGHPAMSTSGTCDNNLLGQHALEAVRTCDRANQIKIPIWIGNIIACIPKLDGSWIIKEVTEHLIPSNKRR